MTRVAIVKGANPPDVTAKALEMVNADKVLEWIKKGAKPSNTVARLLKAKGVEGMEKFIIEMPDRKKKEKLSSAKAPEDGSPSASKKQPKVKLSREEMIRLTTWVDSNAQYYGSYYGRRNLRYREHPNFRPAPTFASAIGVRPIKDEKDR